MNPNHTRLISKFADKSISMAIIMFVQAAVAAETAFLEFDRLQHELTQASSKASNNDVSAKVMRALAHARFFSEACGWSALAARRFRQEGSAEMHLLLVNDKPHIDALYNLRRDVNHTYNEDLADVYRTGRYVPGTHQPNLAFNFELIPNGPGFRIGTLEVSIVSQLASIQKIEIDLLALP